MYIDNKLIVLNSKDAQQLNGANLSYCIFNCQGLLTDEDNIIRTYVSLINAQIPCSFYNIDSTNNKLEYGQLSSNLNFTIPVGNYSSSSLITQLIQGFGQSTVTSIVLDKATGKLVFTFNTFTSLQPETTMYSILGIQEGTEFSCFANVAKPTTYPLNLLGIKRITIASDELNIMSYNSKGDANILATIEVNQPPFNMLTYEQQTDLNKHILHSKTLNLIDIKMFDENRNFINFNNVNWTMTLCLSIERNNEAYAPESLSKLIKKITEAPLETPLETTLETTLEKSSKGSNEFIPSLTENEKELQLLEE